MLILATSSKKKKAAENEASKTDSSETDPKESVAKTEAIAYLNRWKNDRSAWKFHKVRQVWLLQNMYNPDLVSKAIIIQYPPSKFNNQWLDFATLSFLRVFIECLYLL